MEAFCRIEASSAYTQRTKVPLSSRSGHCLVPCTGLGQMHLTQQPLAVDVFELLLSKFLLSSSRRSDASRIHRHGVRPEGRPRRIDQWRSGHGTDSSMPLCARLVPTAMHSTFGIRGHAVPTYPIGVADLEYPEQNITRVVITSGFRISTKIVRT